MTDIRCGTCRHYEPIRNPETGRIRPSEGGKCAWEHPRGDDPLPECMRDPWMRNKKRRLGDLILKYRARCYANSGGGCECWEVAALPAPK